MLVTVSPLGLVLMQPFPGTGHIPLFIASGPLLQALGSTVQLDPNSLLSGIPSTAKPALSSVEWLCAFECSEKLLKGRKQDSQPSLMLIKKLP